MRTAEPSLPELSNFIVEIVTERTPQNRAE